MPSFSHSAQPKAIPAGAGKRWCPSLTSSQFLSWGKIRICSERFWRQGLSLFPPASPPPRTCVPSCWHCMMRPKAPFGGDAFPSAVRGLDNWSEITICSRKSSLHEVFQIFIQYSNEMQEILLNAWWFTGYCCLCCIYIISIFFSSLFFFISSFPSLPSRKEKWVLLLGISHEKRQSLHPDNGHRITPDLLSQSHQPPPLCVPEGQAKVVKRWWKKGGDNILGDKAHQQRQSLHTGANALRYTRAQRQRGTWEAMAFLPS